MTTKIDANGLTLPDSSVIAARPSIFLPGDLKAGDYYLPPGWLAGSPTSRTADNYRYIALFLPTTMTFDRIGLNITIAASAGKKAIVGVYKHTNGFIGTLQFDAGEIAIDAVAFVVATIDQQLTAGWWWVVSQLSEACTLTVINSTAIQPSWTATPTSALAPQGFMDSVAYATSLPATPAVVVGDIDGTAKPWVYLRLKSIP